MNWKAAAKELKKQRDEAVANLTRAKLQAAIDSHRAAMSRAERYEETLQSPNFNDSMLRLTGVLDAERFRLMMNGHLNLGVIIDFEFARRFPKEHADFMKEMES